MRFARLLYAVSTGLLQQIPIMGPVLGSILAVQDRIRLEKLLTELIEQLSISRAEPVGEDKALVSALHLAQAEISQRLVTTARPRNRFLYLAARHYAGPERTLEIAEAYGFLWRSYHKSSGAAVGKVLACSPFLGPGIKQIMGSVVQ